MLNLLPESAAGISKPKHTLLPVLVVLFIFSYGLMTMLIVEQGRTIDIQRVVIGELSQDSAQLTALRGNAIRQAQARAQAEAQARAEAQTPSSQAAPQEKKDKMRRSAPLRPPKDTSDSSDVRRSLVVI